MGLGSACLKLVAISLMRVMKVKFTVRILGRRWDLFSFKLQRTTHTLQVLY